MKRPAKDAHAAHREQDQRKDHQEANRHGQQERLTNDVGCEHPTNMQKASGSNKYYARMVCRACGLLLYKVDRRLDHNLVQMVGKIFGKTSHMGKE